MLARPQDERVFLICFRFFPVQVNDDFGHVWQSLTNLTDTLLRNISSLEFSQSMVGLNVYQIYISIATYPRECRLFINKLLKDMILKFWRFILTTRTCV